MFGCESLHLLLSVAWWSILWRSDDSWDNNWSIIVADGQNTPFQCVFFPIMFGSILGLPTFQPLVLWFLAIQEVWGMSSPLWHGLQVKSNLTGHSTGSEPPLTEHILQVVQTVGSRFCSWGVSQFHYWKLCLVNSGFVSSADFPSWFTIKKKKTQVVF